MTTETTIAPTRRRLFDPTAAVDASVVVGAKLRVLARNTSVRVFAIYAAIAVIANLPSWPGNPTRITTCACGGASDPIQTAWFLLWFPYAILHGHNPFFTTAINYPSGVNLAQNTEMPLLGLLASPLTLLVNPVASMNLLRFLAFLLSAFSAYYVLRRFVRYAPAAFIAGLLYGFSPYMVTQASVHLDLSFVPLPPLILYGVFELVVRQRDRPLKWGLITGACAAAQFYISAEILATTALVAGIGLFFLFFLCIKEVPRRFAHAAIGLAVAAGVTGLCIGYPLWFMFHGPAHYAGPAQGYNEIYNADLLGTIVPTSAQLFAPAHLRTIGTSLVGGRADIDENGTYLGIFVILITASFVGRYWRRLWMPFLALMAFTAFALSLGPYLYVDRAYVRLPFNLPFRKINHLPGVDNILPVRLSLYVIFFVAVIVALGIDYYHDDIVARRARRDATTPRSALPKRVVIGRFAGAAIALAGVVSLVPHWPYTSKNPKLLYAETTSGLSIIPTGSVVLTYPYATAGSADAMLWQTLSSMRFRILGGYALVPGRKGGATTFPTVLMPEVVEAMLVNSVGGLADPILPSAVASPYSVIAKQIRILPRGVPLPKIPPAGATDGRIASYSLAYSNAILTIRHTATLNIELTPTTRYLDPYPLKKGAPILTRGERVIITGTRTAGTVNQQTTELLRQFVARNHVTAIDIELGRLNSWEITKWMQQAFGPATRAGGGGEVWIHPHPPRASVTSSLTRG